MNGVVSSLVGVNLTFIVAVIILTIAAAPRLFDRIVTARPAKLRSGRVLLVRLPSPDLADGVVTHMEKSEIDTELADTQWADYVDAFRAEGWNILEVPIAPDLADSVFVEDAVVVFGDVAVITRPGSEHRLAEIDDVETTVRSLGMSVARITEPATLDGGDVLVVGDTVYVGRGGRTNAEGVAQLRELLRPSGRTVVAVPVTGALHLKSAVTALPDGTVIGDPSSVDPRLFPSFLEMPEPEGAHVVELAPGVVLMSDAAPRSKELVESLGYRVVTVGISEFEKLEGCVTCLSVRIR
ncbi:N(G),N(G)-dimethylarginine dimethylaminohydrolase [Amnibacterium flavum]|uniref:N(G),N(G)-dimethylarginine dimethylaminohydrolase n=2 Tax=Amnibacterium flavum TaxID=2173173 RepID=A0A2V1HY08_9MICO|nr:N(G),N(G)-dimethylarginine dimethylaminohydrolase [Amnibacterium flavum]